MTQPKKPALQTYNKIDQVPLKYEKRPVTDVCCLILGVVFTLIIILIAIIAFSYQNYLKSNFPSDSNGSLCGIDLPNYQYLYFSNLPEINRRVCVTSCPKQGDTKLKCSPTDDVGCTLGSSGDFVSNYYQSQNQQGRGGFFCWPTDQKQRQNLLDRTNLRDRNVVYNSIDVIVLSFYISLVVSIIYFLLVQFFPTKMIYIGTIAGLVMLLAAIICLAFYQTHHTTVKVIILIVMIGLFIFAVLSTWKNPNSLRMHSIFLKWSTVVLKDRILTTLYIPLFMLILAMFIGLLIFEFTGFWTGGNIDFDPNYNIYHQLSGVFPTIMTVILVVQMIWGLSFVKQAFNFCVSGNAVLWFYQEKYNTFIIDPQHPSHRGFLYPVKLLIMKHFGSVVAAAFMNGFLSFYDSIFDFFRPNTVDSKNQNIFGKCCDIFANFFDLVRSDTMAFVNLSGNPYCNSARYCQYLCMRSKIMDYSQATSRIYRVCSHFLLAGIVTIIAMYMKGNISIFALLLVFLQSLFVSTMFITFHADITDALQIIFLEMQQFYERDNRGTSTYKRQNLHQLSKDKLREPLVKQIADERKRENDELQNARQQQKQKTNQ